MCNGASYTFGGVVGHPLLGVGVGVNKVIPKVDKSSPVHGAHAIEYVIGSAGINSDYSVTAEIEK